jgi:TfoX/Sxy family transcriptional regulator of competence genes
VAYDTDLAERLREALSSEPDVTERKMFGGLAFLVRGHMTVVASSQGGLMIRADPTTTATLVETTPAVYAEMRGRTMNGWLRLTAVDVDPDDEFARWIDRALSYTSTLPPKQ